MDDESSTGLPESLPIELSLQGFLRAEHKILFKIYTGKKPGIQPQRWARD